MTGSDRSGFGQRVGDESHGAPREHPNHTVGVSMSDEPLVIFETVHGSTAYGLAREGSDVDVKGIVVGPRSWYLGPTPGPEQLTLSADHVRYELRRFVRLALDANPNVIELLWTRPEHHLVLTPPGERLLAERDRFLSRRVADRFGGYAMAQLKRIRTHRAWLLTPPTHPPTRDEFGLPERTVIPADQLAAAERLISEGDGETADVSPNFLAVLDREKRYKAARQSWTQYQGWLANRNPARAELEARHGYDTKHAMHLIRLQRMAVEILETGEVHVHRPDRDELLAVRDGAWSYEEIEAAAEGTLERIRAAAVTSPLPDEPDEAGLTELCVDMCTDHLGVAR